MSEYHGMGAEVANRDEYLEDRLRRAAEIVYLWLSGSAEEVQVLPDDGWARKEIAELGALLYAGRPVDSVARLAWVQWRALEIMNLPRITASSSRARGW